MARVLVLENETIGETDRVNRFIEMFKEEGHSIVIIEHAHIQPKEVLLEAIMSADKLLFQTTWLRTDELYPFGKLLAVANPMEIYAISLDDKSLEYNIEETFGLDILCKLGKHKLFDVERRSSMREVNLKIYKERVDKEEEERQTIYKGLNKTGHKILIKKIQAFGGAWSNLKEGDIVEEIDNSAHDPNPKRGVWVMGNGEPVKLLNSDGYDEFEFAEDKCKSLVRDFYARGNRLDDKDGMEIMADYINSALRSQINKKETTLWEFCDDICNMVGVERRGNRHYFNARLEKYLDKHQYFCELNKF